MPKATQTKDTLILKPWGTAVTMNPLQYHHILHTVPRAWLLFPEQMPRRW